MKPGDMSETIRCPKCGADYWGNIDDVCEIDERESDTGFVQERTFECLKCGRIWRAEVTWKLEGMRFLEYEE